MADLEGRALYVNPAGCELIGLDPARVAESRLVDFCAPATEALFERETIPAALREGVVTGEWELRQLGTGEPIAVEGTLFVVRDPATNAPFAISTVLRDVRVRRLAEAQLRESEERFRRLADTIPALVWMSDTTGDATYFNRRWLEFTGRLMDEELGDGWFASVHPDDAGRVREIDARALAERGSFSLEYRLARHDGVYRWVLSEGLPRFTSTGEFAGHIGACIDIDDRKRAEERQRFVAEASTVLASSLRVDETLGAVARLAVPTVADWCSIALVTDDGAIKTVAVAHDDPAMVDSALRVREQHPPDPAALLGPAAVIRTGEPELWTELPDELLADASRDRPELLELLRELRLRSAVIVPLVARDKVLGALTFVTTAESGRILQENDLALALEIARRAATAVDNARLFQQTDFQRALLERQGEASIDGLLVVAPDGAILSSNRRFAEIWQIPDETIAQGDEAALESAFRRVEDPDAFVARVRELYERRETSREELRFRDGRTIERYGAPVTGADGSYLGYLWSFRDITDRKRIERRLRRSEERFRSLLSATTQIIWTTNAAGHIVERTPSWEAFTGQSSSEYMGPEDGWSRAVHPDDRERLRAQWATAVAEAPSVHEVRYRLRRQDGEYRRVEVRAVPIRDADGTVREWVGSIVDVEDQLRARAEADARAEAAKALEFVADGVFLVDADDRVALWTPAATRITGLDQAAVVGRPLVEALPGWPLADLGERSETLPVDVRGRELWLSFSTVRFPEGTVYAFRDLTEEHALERLKTDFVSTVSHELRTPLAAIYGAAMTLQRTDVVLGDDQRTGLLGVVAGESERLARIVNDVLWASRLDSGVLEVSIESCDAGALAAVVVAAARIHLPAAIELTLTVAPDLPEVAADPDKVRQVLVNLVDNAIKYSPDGGLVEVRVEPVGRSVRFTVSDRGLGIPASEHDRIFEKFFRLDPNLTRGVGGTGLGLYICRELVRRMDGRIRVESAEGAGSIFTFELPVAE
jgi:PAS domain S-box-containing protein